ncbi:hypothetical protein [Natrialba chahannaoensis]|nr:hypothetical protein [Natrialba chahannaoensis]
MASYAAEWARLSLETDSPVASNNPIEKPIRKDRKLAQYETRDDD